jgi:hypothetical protein
LAALNGVPASAIDLNDFIYHFWLSTT